MSHSLDVSESLAMLTLKDGELIDCNLIKGVNNETHFQILNILLTLKLDF